MRNKHTKYFAPSLAINLLIVSIALGQDSKITLDKVRDHVKKAAEICRTVKPPMKPRFGKPFPGEPGEYMKTIEPVVSAGKPALSLLEKLIESGDLDTFEVKVAKILLERINDPDQFDLVKQYLKPFTDDPFLKLHDYGDYGVAPRKHWSIHLKPFKLDLLHQDLQRADHVDIGGDAYLQRGQQTADRQPQPDT